MSCACILLLPLGINFVSTWCTYLGRSLPFSCLHCDHLDTSWCGLYRYKVKQETHPGKSLWKHHRRVISCFWISVSLQREHRSCYSPLWCSSSRFGGNQGRERTRPASPKRCVWRHSLRRAVVHVLVRTTHNGRLGSSIGLVFRQVVDGRGLVLDIVVYGDRRDEVMHANSGGNKLADHE